MKQISLRQFRTSVATLDEPVRVVLNRDGEVKSLGTWTPEDESPRTFVDGSIYERLVAYWTSIHAASGHDHKPMDCPDVAQFKAEWQWNDATRS